MNDRPATLGDRLFVALQYLLPQHLLSRLLGRLAHARLAPLKNALIRHAAEDAGLGRRQGQHKTRARRQLKPRGTRLQRPLTGHAGVDEVPLAIERHRLASDAGDRGRAVDPGRRVRDRRYGCCGCCGCCGRRGR